MGSIRRRLNWIFGWAKTVFKWLKVIYDNKWILTALTGVMASVGVYQRQEMTAKDEQIAMTQKQIASVAESYRSACINESTPTVTSEIKPQPERPSRLIESLIREHVRQYH